MEIAVVDPTEIPDWDLRLREAGGVDFFNAAAWAKVLKESYRYKPLYLEASENGRLGLSMPMVEVDSVWTGKRGISLPFADRCVPYFRDRKALGEAVEFCLDHGRRAGWRYVEWRAREYHEDGTTRWGDFYSHDIALARSEEDLFAGLAASNRRNIKKALREGLAVEIGTTWGALDSFCKLNVLTRKRHGLPPQPRRFFEKVFEHVLAAGQGVVVAAKCGDRAVAASVFFHFGTQALFKYGASDAAFHRLRPNNLIMWEAIRWYKNRGFENLSLGRTESDNPGLLRYKRAWGAEEGRLWYYHYDFGKRAYLARKPGRAFYKPILKRAPVSWLRAVGSLIYRHMG